MRVAKRAIILDETVGRNPFIPTAVRDRLTPRQAQFLSYDGREALYGGAAGGGKSFAMLMAALQYADVPGYHALILRRTHKQLSKAESILSVSKEWLTGKAAWNGESHTWTFPVGSTLEFGHMEHEDSKYNYQGAAYRFVGYDELTQFTETMYTYLFSRQRREADSVIPLRMRAASNPGGVGHEWVKKRFVAPGPRSSAGRFYPARIADNPNIDQASYLASLQELDPITRAQLVAGDWDAFEGGRFRREWFRRYAPLGERVVGLGHTPDAWQMGSRSVLSRDCAYFVCVDPAAREADANDYTAILAGAVTPARQLLVLEVVRNRLALDAIVPEVAEVCQRWHPGWVGLEANGFQMGLVLEARRHAGIKAVVVELEHQGRDKLIRATPAILLAEQGGLWLPEWAPWLDDFEAELRQFTGDDKRDPFDDQVDALAYAVLMMHQNYNGGGGTPFRMGSRGGA
jgi:predicted phage terminase large subunit-like protein